MAVEHEIAPNPRGRTRSVTSWFIFGLRPGMREEAGSARADSKTLRALSVVTSFWRSESYASVVESDELPEHEGGKPDRSTRKSAIALKVVIGKVSSQSRKRYSFAPK